MRLSRTDLVPVLAIIGGGALGVVASGALVLSSRSDDAPVAVRTVVVPDGQRISYWSSDGRIEYRPICPRTPGFSPPYPCSGDVSAPVLGVAPPVTVESANGERPPTSEQILAWSPDGSRIAFTSSRDGHQQIWVVNADGGTPTRLTANTLPEAVSVLVR